MLNDKTIILCGSESGSTPLEDQIWIRIWSDHVARTTIKTTESHVNVLQKDSLPGSVYLFLPLRQFSILWYLMLHNMKMTEAMTENTKALVKWRYNDNLTTLRRNRNVLVVWTKAENTHQQIELKNISS